MATLTAAGEKLAREKSSTSIVANVALYGHERGWPAHFVDASIEVMNEEARDDD